MYHDHSYFSNCLFYKGHMPEITSVTTGGQTIMILMPSKYNIKMQHFGNDNNALGWWSYFSCSNYHAP